MPSASPFPLKKEVHTESVQHTRTKCSRTSQTRRHVNTARSAAQQNTAQDARVHMIHMSAPQPRGSVSRVAGTSQRGFVPSFLCLRLSLQPQRTPVWQQRQVPWRFSPVEVPQILFIDSVEDTPVWRVVITEIFCAPPFCVCVWWDTLQCRRLLRRVFWR